MATLGGVDLDDGTAFSMTATFNAAIPIYTEANLGLFDAITYSFLINGTTYTGSGGLSLLFQSPTGSYSVSFQGGGGTVMTDFSGATTDFHAATPAPTVFSTPAGNFSAGSKIALAGVSGDGLVINEVVGSTASITGSSIPEPSTYAAIFGTVILGFAAIYRHKSKVDFA